MISQTILITGASRGIGLSAALVFARAGHKVIATMRHPERCPELVQMCKSEGLNVRIITLDVNDDSSVAECFRIAYKEYGRIDVLINNAGIERHGSIEESSMEHFHEVMETNYFGAIRCIKAVMPHMRQFARGCIINVSSVAGKISNPPLGPYSASKHALESITETLAIEANPFNIRVYLVEPGIIDTDMAREIGDIGSSIYPHTRRMAGLFMASLNDPADPDIVAEKLLWLVQDSPSELRHPVGPDAAPYIGWRSSMTDEEWIAWHSVDDDEWYDKMESEFGLKVREALAFFQ